MSTPEPPDGDDPLITTMPGVHPLVRGLVRLLQPGADGATLTFAKPPVEFAPKVRAVEEPHAVVHLVDGLIALAYFLDVEKKSHAAAQAVLGLAALVQPALLAFVGGSVDWAKVKRFSASQSGVDATHPVHGIAAKPGAFGVGLGKRR